MTRAKSLAHLGEFGFLKKLLPTLYWPSSLHSQLCIGPGDDAGVIRLSPGKVLVASTDAMIEDVHFERRWFSWEMLGQKILSVNLSDLAAMGNVRPLAALVTAAFPGDTPVDSVDKFYQGLESCARRWKTGLLGGDTVGSRSGGWFVSLTILGEANPKELVRRDKASPDDLIVITGNPGQATAGLEVLQAGKQKWGWTRPLVRAFSAPVPCFSESALLGQTQWATSLIDSSDGLEASILLLAQSSGGLGAEVDLNRLPLSRALQQWAQHRQRPAVWYALSGGEDYGLVFTLPPGRWPALQKQIPHARVIGCMRSKGKGCWAFDGARRYKLHSYGFSHFKTT